LRNLGVADPPGWFNDRTWAIPTLILMRLWASMGGTQMIIFLAGLQGIPTEMYDAAAIDGANGWQRLRHITIPLLSPTTFFLTMLGVIGTFKAFSHVYVMQLPGARETTTTAAIFIFNEFYKSSKFGYAAALAFILFAIILLLTVVQNRIMGRRVFYG